MGNSIGSKRVEADMETDFCSGGHRNRDFYGKTSVIGKKTGKMVYDAESAAKTRHYPKFFFKKFILTLEIIPIGSILSVRKENSDGGKTAKFCKTNAGTDT